MTQPTSSIAGLARDAAAPLLLLAALAAALLATGAVWVAAGIATLLGTGNWTTPTWGVDLLPRLLTDGASALIGPAASTVGFVAVLIVFAAGAIGAAALGWQRTRPRNPATRSLLRGHQLGDLTGHAAHTKRASCDPTSPLRAASATSAGWLAIR
jgi:hypothetical protein